MFIQNVFGKLMNAFLKSGNLILRPIAPEDKELFLVWHNDPEMRNCIGGIFPFTEYTYREICKGSEVDTPPNIWFSLCLDSQLIGIAGLHSIRYIQRNAEIALLIGESEYRNKGYGSRVLELLVEYAFHTLNLHRVYACIFSQNTAPMRLVEKCSFLKEGTLRDSIYWNGAYRDVIIYARLSNF